MSSQPYSSPYPAIAQVDVGGVSTLLPDTSTIGIEVDVAVAGLASHTRSRPNRSQQGRRRSIMRLR